MIKLSSLEYKLGLTGKNYHCLADALNTIGFKEGHKVTNYKFALLFLRANGIVPRRIKKNDELSTLILSNTDYAKEVKKQAFELEERISKTIEKHLIFENNAYTPKVVMTASTDDYKELTEVMICSECGIEEDHYGEFEKAQVAEFFVSPNMKYQSCCSCSHKEKINIEERTDYLDSDFWADSLYELVGTFCDMARNNGLDAAFYEGRNLNWRGSSGHATIDSLHDADAVLSKLYIGNDFNLSIDLLHDGTMEAVCAHHDATSYMTVRPTANCCREGEVIHPDELDKSAQLASIINALDGCNDYDNLSDHAYDSLLEGFVDDFPEPLKNIWYEIDFMELTPEKIGWFKELSAMVEEAENA